MEENGANNRTENVTNDPMVLLIGEGSEGTPLILEGENEKPQEKVEEKENNVPNTCEAKGAEENDQDQSTQKQGEDVDDGVHNNCAAETQKEGGEKENNQITEEIREKGESVHQGHLNNHEGENEDAQRMQVKRDDVYHNVLNSFEAAVKEIEACNKRDATTFEVDSGKIEQLRNCYSLVHVSFILLHTLGIFLSCFFFDL